jgi:hypothetical protein
VYEYRGRVAIAGSDNGATTFPNLLKKVGQDKILGGSVGSVLPLSNLCNTLGPRDPKVKHLNAALSCGKARVKKQK